jgi:hypothetical protein
VNPLMLFVPQRLEPRRSPDAGPAQTSHLAEPLNRRPFAPPVNLPEDPAGSLMGLGRMPSEEESGNSSPLAPFDLGLFPQGEGDSPDDRTASPSSIAETERDSPTSATPVVLARAPVLSPGASLRMDREPFVLVQRPAQTARSLSPLRSGIGINFPACHPQVRCPLWPLFLPLPFPPSLSVSLYLLSPLYPAPCFDGLRVCWWYSLCVRVRVCMCVWGGGGGVVSKSLRILLPLCSEALLFPHLQVRRSAACCSPHSFTLLSPDSLQRRTFVTSKPSGSSLKAQCYCFMPCYVTHVGGRDLCLF